MLNGMDFNLVGDRLLVRPLGKGSAELGLADTLRGEVLAVGDDLARETGPSRIAVGDEVVFGEGAGRPVRVDDDEMRLLHKADVVMVYPAQGEPELEALGAEVTRATVEALRASVATNIAELRRLAH